MQKIVKRVELIQQQALDIASFRTQSLSIAVVEVLPREALHQLILSYAQRKMGILSTTTLLHAEAIACTIDGQYDGCFVMAGERVRKAGLETVPLLNRPITLSIPRNMPLAEKAQIELTDFEGLTLLVPEPGIYACSDAFLEELKQNNIHPRIVYNTNLMNTKLYCWEHHACHLAFYDLMDSQMMRRPIVCQTLNPLCLAFRPESKATLRGLIQLTEEIHNTEKIFPYQ